MDVRVWMKPKRTFQTFLLTSLHCPSTPLNKSGRTFDSMLKRLQATARDLHSTDIAYLQSQNSNLTNSGDADGGSGDLLPLLQDICATQGENNGAANRFSSGTALPWADEALGKRPEATNLWIGTSASRTSMHRDHYENLFTVLRGTKIFTLYPPFEAHFLCDGACAYWEMGRNAWQSSWIPFAFAQIGHTMSGNGFRLASLPESGLSHQHKAHRRLPGYL